MIPIVLYMQSLYHFFMKYQVKIQDVYQKKLLEYTNAFNWRDIDFPASYEDYTTFERLNDAVALNILYLPLNEVNICPEYISKRNFDKKTSGSTIKNW